MINPTPQSPYRKYKTEYKLMGPQAASCLAEGCDYIMGYGPTGRSASLRPESTTECFETELLVGASRNGPDLAWPLRTLRLSIQRDTEYKSSQAGDTYDIALRWIINRAGLGNPDLRQQYLLTIPQSFRRLKPSLLVAREPSTAFQLPIDSGLRHAGDGLEPVIEVPDASFGLPDTGTEYDAEKLFDQLGFVMDAMQYVSSIKRK